MFLDKKMFWRKTFRLDYISMWLNVYTGVISKYDFSNIPNDLKFQLQEKEDSEYDYNLI